MTTQVEQVVMHNAASASGNGATINVNGMSVAILELSGTFTASVAFEALVRDSWVAISATNIATGTAATTASTAGSYRLNIAGFTQLRAVVTWTSGTSITIVGHTTNAGATDSSGGGAGGGETTLASAAHTTTVTFTRPSNTTAYAVNDAIGDTSGSAILAFANLCGTGGGNVFITSVELEVDAATSSIGTTTLRLYNAAPTAIADNAAWDLVSDDRSKYLGSIKLATPTDEVSTLFSNNDGINKHILMTGTSLYCILTTDTAFTPGSATVKRITIHTFEV